MTDAERTPEPWECWACGWSGAIGRPRGAVSWHPRCKCGAGLYPEGATPESIQAVKRATREALNRRITPEQEAEMYDYEREHTISGAFKNLGDACRPLIDEISESARRFLRRLFR